jgi:hypothetical protein
MNYFINERTFSERAHDAPRLPTDTGDNIIMIEIQLHVSPPPKKVIPLTDFLRSNPIHA